MRCGETREYLFAFLDNELDVPLSIELQRHLDGCPDCAREAEIERTVGKRLAGAIATADATLPEMGDDLAALFPGRAGESAADKTPARRAPFRWSRRLAAAAVVVLVVGAGLWQFVGNQRHAPGWAGLVIDDFTHFLEEGQPLQIESNDGAFVSAWLREKTAIQVSLPLSLSSTYTLLGGRKCKIDGQPAAFAVYKTSDSVMSLVVVAENTADLLDMDENIRDGRRYWVDRRNEYTVVACRRRGLVYAAVSHGTEEEALPLLVDGPSAGD